MKTFRVTSTCGRLAALCACFTALALGADPALTIYNQNFAVIRADDRRSGSGGSEVSHGEESVLVGGRVSGERRERRRVAKHTFTEGQPTDATAAESGCSIGGQGQRKYI